MEKEDFIEKFLSGEIGIEGLIGIIKKRDYSKHEVERVIKALDLEAAMKPIEDERKPIYYAIEALREHFDIPDPLAKVSLNDCLNMQAIENIKKMLNWEEEEKPPQQQVDPPQQQVDPTHPQLPAELSTDKAMKYWKKAQEAELVDENYIFVKGITQQTKVYFIHRLCQKLGFDNRWVGLEPFTRMDNQQMARVFSKIPYEAGNRIFNHVERIDKIFTN